MKPGWFRPVRSHQFKARLAHYFSRRQIEGLGRKEWYSLCNQWFFHQSDWKPPEGWLADYQKCRLCAKRARTLILYGEKKEKH